MKELRPGSAGWTEIRVFFAFDMGRQAILPVGGDKNDEIFNQSTRSAKSA